MTGTLLLFHLLAISIIPFFIVILPPAPFTLHKVQLPLVLPVEPVEDANVAKDVACLARGWVRKRIETDRTGTAVGVIPWFCWLERNGENGQI